jgi:hypothetical protein
MIGQTAVAWPDAEVGRVVRTDARAFHGTVAFYGLLLITLAAPFEMQAPLVSLPGQSISNLETCVAVAIVAWAAALAMTRALPAWRTPLTWPWMASLAAMAAASAFSPVSKMNALHMTGRGVAALAVYLLAVNALGGAPGRVRILMTALVASASFAAALAVLEYLRIETVVVWLRAFRPDFAWVGSQLRAGGPFQYPSIASMYFEVAVACGLGLWAMDRPGDQRGGWTAPLLFGALLLTGDAIVLTYTRSGLMTVAASILIVGALRVRRWGFDGGTTLVASLGLALGLLAVTSRPSQALWLRFTTEGQEAWYRMAVEAPPEVAFAPDQILTIPVAVTNLGRVTWDSRVDPPFSFSSHWYDTAGARVVAFYGIRNIFPAPVKPGETVSLDARVRAPREPGRYQLVWDIEYKGRLWFSTEQGATPAVSRAVVAGAPFTAPVAGRSETPRVTGQPGRLVLWRAAALMLLSRPVFGFGPDNFRLSYGAYAGLPSADDRIHSNNMYLELAVGAGIVGCLAFAWLLWSIARVVRELTRLRDDDAAVLGFGVAAALAAIALHGLVDSFLGFTSTYVLFALTLGCAAALAQTNPRPGRNPV